MKTQFFVMLGLLLLGTNSFAQSVSHNYINTSRSSWQNHVFVSQAIEGEFGDVKKEGDFKDGSGAVIASVKTGKWRGYNLTSTLGLELMKFIQFNISHSSINMKAAKGDLEKLSGSRLSGGARLVFLAPIGNLEAGGGIIGTRYDYQKELSSADFYGSGYYYSLGINYFFNDRVSMLGMAKMISEHSVKGGGDAEASTLSANTTNIGIGFSLWL